MQISLAQGIQLISQLNSEIQAKRFKEETSEIVFQKVNHTRLLTM